MTDTTTTVDDDGTERLASRRPRRCERARRRGGRRRRHRRAARARRPLEPRRPDQGPAAAPAPAAVAVHRRGRALRAEHLADLPRRRLHLRARSSAPSSPSTILRGASIISASPRLRTSSLAMIMGFVLVIVVSGGLLSLGPSLDDSEGGRRRLRRSRRAARRARSTVDGRSRRLKFNVHTRLHRDGRRHRRSTTAAPPATPSLFTDPKLAGFELADAGDRRRARSS